MDSFCSPFFFSLVQSSPFFFCQSGFLGGLGEPNLHVDFFGKWICCCHPEPCGPVVLRVVVVVLAISSSRRAVWPICRQRVQVQTLTGACCGWCRCGGDVGVLIFFCVGL